MQMYLQKKIESRTIDNSPQQRKPQRNSCFQSCVKVIQMDKTKHTDGDLYYGISDPRYDGYKKISGAPAVTPTDSNPISVDQLNKDAKITEKMNDPDTMKGYFAAIGVIDGHTKGVSTKISDKWLDFLQDEKPYLLIDKEIVNIQSTTPPTNPSKDRLAKNGITSDKINVKNAIVAAYNNKSLDATHSTYDNEVNDWTWDVFFRRTSKLGIKFTIDNGRTIHMNTFSPAWRTMPNSALENVANSYTGTERMPITFSEIRYINRKYGAVHPNIDFYKFDQSKDPDVSRTASDGEMPLYINGRIAAGKVNFKI